MVYPKKFWLIFLSIFVAAFYLYLPSFRYYFFQDDWFVLNWVSFGNLGSFFSFRTDIIYWRPLSMPILFAFTKTLFDLNPFGYHILAFFIFCLLIVVIYHLFLILSGDKKQALLGSFLYALWPIHYISLSWFSTTSYIIGPLFQCLSFIFLIKFAEKKMLAFKFVSYLFFILGLMSSEFTLVLPFIFLSWGFLFKKKNYLSFIMPLVIIDAIYLALRFIIYPIPATGNYSPTFNPQVIYNFVWYILWALGLPERFKSLIDPRIPTQSLKVITQFWTITFPFFMLTILISAQIIKNFKKNINLYAFGFLWFLIGLLPVLFITNHSYPVYLSFAGLGFLYILLTSAKKSKVGLALLVFIWTIVSVTNLQFTRITHWITNEQSVSRAYVDWAKSKAHNPPAYSVFLFKSANIKFAQENHFVLVETEETLKLSLGDQNAIQAIYNDPTLKSLYENNNQHVSLPSGTQIFKIAPSL